MFFNKGQSLTGLDAIRAGKHTENQLNSFHVVWGGSIWEEGFIFSFSVSVENWWDF